MTEQTQKRNSEARLSHGNFYMLCEVAKKLPAPNKRIPMTSTEIAAQWAETFGFPVSNYSVNQVLKTIGVTAKYHRDGKVTQPRTRTKAELIAEVDALKIRTKWLEDTILSVAMAAGVDIDHGENPQ